MKYIKTYESKKDTNIVLDNIISLILAQVETCLDTFNYLNKFNANLSLLLSFDIYIKHNGTPYDITFNYIKKDEITSEKLNDILTNSRFGKLVLLDNNTILDKIDLRILFGTQSLKPQSISFDEDDSNIKYDEILTNLEDNKEIIKELKRLSKLDKIFNVHYSYNTYSLEYKTTINSNFMDKYLKKLNK